MSPSAQHLEAHDAILAGSCGSCNNMTGWIFQTRKIISTVMSSLADDLEQTVQEVNDVIYRLGSTHDDRSSTHLQASQDTTPEIGGLHFDQQPPHKQLHLLPPAEQPAPQSQNQASLCSEQFKITQTRQPETFGFSSTSNSSRCQSSPTLQLSEYTVAVGEDAFVGTRSLEYKSSVHSLISSPSPCLRYGSADRVSLVISEHQLGHSHLNPKSPQSSKHTLISVSPNVCPCHRQDSLKITHGMKHPGRVIRTQSAPTQEQDQSCSREESVPPAVIEGHYRSFNETSSRQVLCEQPDDPAPRSECDLKGRKPYSHQGEEESSTVVLVEHNTRLPRWTNLGPLARMLSFAFAQLANVLLIFSASSQSAHSLTSSAPGAEASSHEVTSAMYPAAIQSPGQMENVSKHQLNEQEVHLLHVAQRTYSTDSFEIIESSCFTSAADGDKLNQRMAPERHTHQTPPAACGDALSDRLEFSSGHFTCEHGTHHHAALTDQSASSTDLVSFDFRKLLTDDQLAADTPGPGSPSQGGMPGAISCSTDNDYVLVRENSLDQTVRGDSNDRGHFAGHHDSGRCDESNDSGDAGADDDDGDSSASFIILSDNDTNNCEYTL